MRYIHAFTLTLLAAFTVACSSDERELLMPDSGQPIHEPLQVSIASPGMTVTRSTIDGTGQTWAGSEKIALVVGNDVNGSGTPASITDHVYYVSASGTSPSLSAYDLANTNYWTSTTEKKKIDGAWSFGTTTAPTLTSHTITSYTLPTTQSATTGELLYSPGADAKVYTASPNSFSLTFYHQLAKVIFNVKSDVSTTVSSPVMSIPGSGTLSAPVTNTTTNNWTFGSVTNITPKTETTTTGYTATYSAVVIPGEYNGKTLLQVTAGGTYKYIPSSSLVLYPGKSYTFSIIIKNGIVFSTVSVTAWTNDTAIELGFK